MNGFVLALLLIPLSGPDGQVIWVNPVEIVSMRAPRTSSGLHEDIQCTLTMADGHFIALIDGCGVVSQKLNGEVPTYPDSSVSAPAPRPVIIQHTTVHQPLKVITKTRVVVKCEPSLIPFRQCPQRRRR